MIIQGHDAPVAAFLAAMRGERPPHAWIFAGPQGLGKATLAQALARRLLAEAADPALPGEGYVVPTDHRITRLVDAMSHPDYLLLERLPKDMKPLRDLDRRDWPKDIERARNIPVDQVREMTAKFTLKPSLSDRRVVLIDAVDDMERGAANAFLKTLEEPPVGTAFILISHAPGRLLPTIRSRCRMLRFAPLDRDVMVPILRSALPAADAAEIEGLVALANGAPGRALALAGVDVGGMTSTLDRIAATGDADNRERVGLAQSMAAKSAQKRYETFLGLVPAYLASKAQARQGAALGEALAQWEQARHLSAHAIPGSLDPQSVTLALAGHVAALAPVGEQAKGRA